VSSLNEAIGLTFSNFLFDIKEMAVTNMYYQEVKNNHFFFCHRYYFFYFFSREIYLKGLLFSRSFGTVSVFIRV
jgi:hypothetical protein